MSPKVIACVDIGRTKTAMAIADINGNIVDESIIRTPLPSGPFRAVEQIAQHLRAMLDESRSSPVVVGVCCPGPLDIERGLILSPPDLPTWTDFPIVKIFEERFGVEVVLDNDANAATLGEHQFGVARGIDNFVYVTLSTGIGGGLIVDGKLVRGLGNGAGEIGHIIVCPDGPLCGCGAAGCVNAVSSGKAIAAAAQEQVANGVPSMLSSIVNNNLEEISARVVIEAARLGDVCAQEVWKAAVHHLAIALGNVLVMFSPEVIVIGGGISAAGDLLFAPLRELLGKLVKIIPAKQIPLLQASLGPQSGIYGMLSLARRKLRAEDFLGSNAQHRTSAVDSQETFKNG